MSDGEGEGVKGVIERITEKEGVMEILESPNRNSMFEKNGYFIHNEQLRQKVMKLSLLKNRSMRELTEKALWAMLKSEKRVRVILDETDMIHESRDLWEPYFYVQLKEKELKRRGEKVELFVSGSAMDEFIHEMSPRFMIYVDHPYKTG